VVVFDTIPAWAVSQTGRRQSSSYRMPPQPWGTGRAGVRRLAGRHPAVKRVEFLPAPRGRGLGWGLLYPAATRIPGLRSLLPMTVVFATSDPAQREVPAA
jgi:hypothetical protein